MKHLLDLVIKIYDLLLRLYPRAFRDEFQEQMLLDFTDMAKDAGQKGRIPFFLFCLRELIDYPLNLVRVHFQQGNMFRVLRSKPVNYGLRNAFVFGLASGLSVIISEFVFTKLFAADNSIFGNLEILYYDLFHTDHGFDFLGWLPAAFASLFTGAIVGMAFAYLFAGRSKWGKYALVSMTCWFLHEEIFDILFRSVNLPFYLGTQDFIALSYASSILSGAFLSLLFYVPRSARQIPLRLLLVGVLGYPILTYIYVKLLFKFYVVEAPWLFIALMIMYGIYFTSVIVIAFISAPAKKIPSFLFLSIAVYAFLPKIGYWIIQLIDPINYPAQMPADSPEYWSFVFRLAVQNAIYGILLGLVIGVLFGLFNRKGPQQILA